MKVRHLALTVSLALAPTVATAATELNEEELKFLHIINAYRAASGAPCLSPSPTMNDAADWFSQEMGEVGFFDHLEPPCDANGDNCTGRDPFDRIRSFGHDRWSTAGENIAAGYPTAEEVFEGWRNSPGHNKNMLEPKFTAIGIGRVEVPGSKYRIYWTTDFSNWVDGPWDCEGKVVGGEEGTGGTGGSSGGTGGSVNPGTGGTDGGTDPGAGGTAGEGSGTGGTGGQDPGAGGRGGSTSGKDDSSSSSGCSAAGSAPALLGILAPLALLRRRRGA
ncbi:CAP domain-containing protein [Vulgatibacter incomptus]|uniref:Flagellar basal-body rod modification protein FlgD n=1 Tax=Vulgatibacter incomptus TaxID=1391653 RepID=A0A0K1PCC7_9BACT|nr:CAP domain-containing protein [Vulgatibacter incomptus]AKU91071.1 Flagellar basal-body rod modification protein FlgD [Vulgatibacter incomptus]